MSGDQSAVGVRPESAADHGAEIRRGDVWEVHPGGSIARLVVRAVHAARVEVGAEPGPLEFGCTKAAWRNWCQSARQVAQGPPDHLDPPRVGDVWRRHLPGYTAYRERTVERVGENIVCYVTRSGQGGSENAKGWADWCRSSDRLERGPAAIEPGSGDGAPQ